MLRAGVSSSLESTLATARRGRLASGALARGTPGDHTRRVHSSGDRAPTVPSHPAPSHPAPPDLAPAPRKLHATACAVLCGTHELAPACVLEATSESGAAARQHGMCTDTKLHLPPASSLHHPYFIRHVAHRARNSLSSVAQPVSLTHTA